MPLVAGRTATLWKLQGVVAGKLLSTLAMDGAGLGLLAAAVVWTVMAFRKVVALGLLLAHKRELFVAAVGMV